MNSACLAQGSASMWAGRGQIVRENSGQPIEMERHRRRLAKVSAIRTDPTVLANQEGRA